MITDAVDQPVLTNCGNPNTLSRLLAMNFFVTGSAQKTVTCITVRLKTVITVRLKTVITHSRQRSPIWGRLPHFGPISLIHIFLPSATNSYYTDCIHLVQLTLTILYTSSATNSDYTVYT